MNPPLHTEMVTGPAGGRDDLWSRRYSLDVARCALERAFGAGRQLACSSGSGPCDIDPKEVYYVGMVGYRAPRLGRIQLRNSSEVAFFKRIGPEDGTRLNPESAYERLRVWPHLAPNPKTSKTA